MKNFIKLPLILLVALVITSCAALRAPDMTKISIGMDKSTVIATLNKKPDAVIGAKKYVGGTVEVLQYAMGVDANDRVNYNWLYFYNNKLVQYGKRDGDWQYTADNIARDNSGR